MIQHLSQPEMLDSIFSSKFVQSSVIESIIEDLEALFEIGVGNSL